MGDFFLRIKWELVMDRAKYYAWQICTKGLFGIIAIAVNAEGLRYVVPSLGQKLHKQPFLSFFGKFAETHRLDLAPILALLILIAVWHLWGKIVLLWLTQSDSLEWTAEAILVTALGSVILVADTLLFYIAAQQVGWGSSVFSFSALLATVTYVCVLIFVSYVSVQLNQKVEETKKDGR